MQTSTDSRFTVSTLDFARLVPLVSRASPRVASSVLDELDIKLVSAAVVDPREILPDVVTMNSKVVLSTPHWSAPREYRLVYPEERVSESGELSVLSALGAQLLAARVGARFTLMQDTASSRVIELLALSYQPEAQGHWQL